MKHPISKDALKCIVLTIFETNKIRFTNKPDQVVDEV